MQASRPKSHGTRISPDSRLATSLGARLQASVLRSAQTRARPARCQEFRSASNPGHARPRMAAALPHSRGRAGVGIAEELMLLVHSTSRAPAGVPCPRCRRSRRTTISSSCPIEQTPTSGCRCSSTPSTDARARSRRLSLRLRERPCLPARTPRCRSSSHREELRALELAPARSQERLRRGACCPARVTRSASTIVAGGRRRRRTGVHAKAQRRPDPSPRPDGRRRGALEIGD
jgi:hypothetical protein